MRKNNSIKKQEQGINQRDYIPNLSQTNSYLRGGKIWKAETLWKFAKKKQYPVKDLPLWAINIQDLPWRVGTLRESISECAAVHDSDLQYPIVLDDYGNVADGLHRIAKAFLLKKKSIKAIRLLEMPKEDDFVK